METVATSVRISGDAIATLSQLASKLGQPKAQVIQRAWHDLEERVFWSEVHEAFARDAKAPEAEAEIAVWERAPEIDVRDEKWQSSAGRSIGADWIRSKTTSRAQPGG